MCIKCIRIGLNLVVGFREALVQLERKFPKVLIHQVVVCFGLAQLLAQLDNLGSELHSQ